MKNGFATKAQRPSLRRSFGRRGGSIQAGGNDGRWGLYGNADYFEENGWRDDSQSQAPRLFGAVSLRSPTGRQS